MRTTVKLVVPLAVSVLSVSLLYGSYQVRTEGRNLRNDLSHRSAVLAENLQESLESSPSRATDRNLSHIVDRYGQREHLLGVAVYDNSGKAIAITPGLSQTFASQPPVAARAVASNKDAGEFLDVSGAPLHLYAVPLHRDGGASGSAVVIYDSRYIHERMMRVVSRFPAEHSRSDVVDYGPGIVFGALGFHFAAGKDRELAAWIAGGSFGCLAGSSAGRNIRPDSYRGTTPGSRPEFGESRGPGRSPAAGVAIVVMDGGAVAREPANEVAG